MAHSLRGRVVAITGGARGIGFATATVLSNLGAKVAIGDIDEVKVKESATRLALKSYGKLDVTDTESFQAFLDDVESTLGPIDVLINNAGIMPTGRIADEPDDVTRRILDINVLGVITGSKLAVQRMLPRGRGHVINIASLAGEIYTPGLATYCASKYAVVGFTDAARVEHRGTGIEFSAVLPSVVNTELSAGIKEIPGQKNCEPEDIARAIVALIERPKSKVRVPALVGALAASQKFFPHQVSEALNRRLHTDTAFLDDVDAGTRQAYEVRARQS